MLLHAVSVALVCLWPVPILISLSVCLSLVFSACAKAIENHRRIKEILKISEKWKTCEAAAEEKSVQNCEKRRKLSAGERRNHLALQLQPVLCLYPFMAHVPAAGYWLWLQPRETLASLCRLHFCGSPWPGLCVSASWPFPCVSVNNMKISSFEMWPICLCISLSVSFPVS